MWKKSIVFVFISFVLLGCGQISEHKASHRKEVHCCYVPLSFSDSTSWRKVAVHRSFLFDGLRGRNIKLDDGVVFKVSLTQASTNPLEFLEEEDTLVYRFSGGKFDWKEIIWKDKTK